MTNMDIVGQILGIVVAGLVPFFVFSGSNWLYDDTTNKTSTDKKESSTDKNNRLQELLVLLAYHNPLEYYYVVECLDKECRYDSVDDQIRFVCHRLNETPFRPQEESLHEVIVSLKEKNKKLQQKIDTQRAYINHLMFKNSRE